jgi:pyruvate,water dikinase
MFKLTDLFKKNDAAEKLSTEASIFHHKYSRFKGLLTANNQALQIIADLEQVIFQDKPFALVYLLERTQRLLGYVGSIVEDLNALSGVKYPDLFDTYETISRQILEELNQKKKLKATHLAIPLEQISLENSAGVGGKAANLGEVYNRVHLPVPPGFAVTAYACQQFLEHNRLPDQIDRELSILDVNDTEALVAVSERIRARIRKAEIPPELQQAIMTGALNLKQKLGRELRLSVRSSATSEDTEASFAGQHSTVLNVGTDHLLDAYKDVVSSMFNPRAIFYRRSKGYRDQDVIMSVACISMIDAKTAGIMYTVDPNDSRHAVIMISAVWGLAVGAVDGSAATDFYQLDKKTGVLEKSHIAPKQYRLISDTEAGLVESPVPAHLQNTACLSDAELKRLLDCGLRLERHYETALDIEWAIGRDEKLYILQSRPLKKSVKYAAESTPETKGAAGAETEPENQLLLEGGASASDGAASGFAFLVTSDHNLHHVPPKAIVVAPQTSPKYVPLMGRIQAIITDVGSVTGHMASVTREFRIPALVGTVSATKNISHGEEITVDATHGRVYRGRVESLLREKPPVNPMKGSPVYRLAQSVLKRIAPLNLTDPNEENFNPAGCRTIHDIIRFAHEMAMQEMFRISDNVESGKKLARPLRIYLPMRIYVIDLRGGLGDLQGRKFAEFEDVISVPFKALLKGMKHEKVDWTHDVGVDWGGFASIVAESVFRDPLKEGMMGEPNYAIVARHYLNFNSRLGYHFATVDTYCGPTVNDNYITFYFKGGAADIGRRSRRALMIALILKRLGFKVERTGDMIRGTLKKYQSNVLEEKLDMLGRLMGSVRLLDMVMSDDGQIEWYVDQFFKENYTFRRGGAEENRPS